MSYSEWLLRVPGLTRDVGRPAPPPRVRAAWQAARAAATLSRVARRGSGRTIGGRVALALAPDTVHALSQGRDVMLVSGTNGKTTTSAFLAAALGTLGPVDANGDGANTPAGFAATLASGSAGRVVLETDEGWLPWAVAQAAPSTVLLLNLSRDQLSRHHEVSRLAAAWREATPGVGTAVANADDPATVWPALAARRQVWVAAGQRWTDDSLTCPACGGRCLRDGTDWSCGCGLRRPRPDWWLEGDELVSPTARLPLELALPGAFNRANAAMALAAAVEAHADPAAALAAIRRIGAVDGRYAWHDVGEHRVRLLLAKNPAGWVELLDLVAAPGAASTPLVLAFNSEGVDGRDPSWLYDVPFERLARRRIVVVGRRATDLQVRLELAGIATTSAAHVPDALTGLPPGPVDVLANYTAFRTAREELARAVRH